MDRTVIVALKDIVVDFDGEPILAGLSLDIHDKEFVTLLGPSGCGKTTTLRVIGGFVEPKAGSVFFAGKDITRVPPYKRQVNTVFQKYALFPHLDVFDNVAFGLRLQKLPDKEVRARSLEMLELVGLKGYEHRNTAALSGGHINLLVSRITPFCDCLNQFQRQRLTVSELHGSLTSLIFLQPIREKYHCLFSGI